MILISEKIRIVSKDKRSGEKNGRVWNSNDISFEDHGLTTTIPFVPERVYEKAEPNKEYIVKYYINPQGKPQINDIELCK